MIRCCLGVLADYELRRKNGWCIIVPLVTGWVPGQSALFGRIMRHVFVSYCREDADFAQIVEQKIKGAEFTTWRDLDVCAGEDWRSEIDGGIKDAVAVLVVMSPQSAQSVYVSYEWAFALGAGVPVIPVLLNLTYSALHPRLSTTQGLDFSGNPPWDKLVTSLKEIAAAERPFTVRVPRDAPPAVQQAARSLDSVESKERDSAIQSLGQMNHPTAVEALVEALRHPTRQVRLQAAVQLIGFHDARAVPELLESQRWKGEEVQPWRIASIGESAVPALVKALQDDDPRVRLGAVSALGTFHSSAAVLALRACLGDPDLELRREAIEALGRTRSSEAVPALRQALSGSEGYVRSALVTALGKCGGKSVVPDLIELARDPDRDVRRFAVSCLTEIKDAASVPALIEALTDSDEQVGLNAARGLQAIGDPQTIPGMIEAWANAGRMAKSFIATAVGSFEKTALPALRAAVRHPSASVRGHAIGLLRDKGDDSDVPVFIESSRDQSAWVRWNAVEALGRRHGPEVVKSLTERLRDDDEDVARAAVSALGAIRDTSAVEALIACLEDKDDQLAQAAASQLQSINTRAARIALKGRNQQAGN
jgi:HEAT repeat protein